MISDITKLGIEFVISPSDKDRIDQCHTELADVRFGALCQLILQAFEHGNHPNPVLLPDLLKDAAGHCSDGHDFLKFIVIHGVPRGLGEALDEAVYSISDESEPFKELMKACEPRSFSSSVSTL